MKTYVICLLYLFSIGCSAALFGAGIGVGAGIVGYTWYKGELQETVSASVPHIHQATLEGLKDLNIRIDGSRHDNLTSKVLAVLANGEEVKINTKSIKQSKSKISIRIGTFGDKKHSMLIMDVIKKHLESSSGKTGQRHK